MKKKPVILLIGTVDTKGDEIGYMRSCIERSGGQVVVMDVGVLGPGAVVPDVPNTEVAAAAGVTLTDITNSGDENTAMTLMAKGASALAARLHADGAIDGMLALGGSMGTDLALDVANALPLGVPKVLLSTIAHSHLLPPERIPPDLIMRLWAGGLYGLNRLCRTALAQSAGAVVGACTAQDEPASKRPVVGMTSLGSSVLTYMKALKGPLEARGYELAVFHATGMGGRAFEDLASRGYFAAVMDFTLQELVNHMNDSCVNSGPDRLRGAGLAGTPQIVAPGATDMVDYPTWGKPPAALEGATAAHAHNRLIASMCVIVPMRRAVAREIGRRLGEARGPTALLVPKHGVEGWDREGGPLHDPQGLAALVDELQAASPPATRLVMLDAHINDNAFAQAALDVFDDWVDRGLVPPGIQELK